MTGEIHSRKDWIIIHCERASSVKTEFLWHFKNVELQELSLKLISKTAILWDDQVSYVEKLWDSYPPFSSVQLLSHVWLFATPWTTAHQASLSIRIHPNSCPSSRWCHPTIPSSAIPFFSCLQSFPASGSFQMSQLFTWGGQIIGVSASASVLHKNIQDWSLEWIGWISLQSKGLSTVFSNTILQFWNCQAFEVLWLSLISVLINCSFI